MASVYSAFGITGASSGIPAPLSQNAPVHWRQPGVRLDERTFKAAEAILTVGIADRNLGSSNPEYYRSLLRERLGKVQGHEGTWSPRNPAWTSPASYLSALIKGKTRNSPDAQRRARVEIMSAEQFVVNAQAGKPEYNETGFRAAPGRAVPSVVPPGPAAPSGAPPEGWKKWAITGGVGFIALISFLLILKARRRRG
jgi:hypothetical protein